MNVRIMDNSDDINLGELREIGEEYWSIQSRSTKYFILYLEIERN